jgi:DsbC/DsbD-like thiol-disulfide interchange protein
LIVIAALFTLCAAGAGLPAVASFAASDVLAEQPERIVKTPHAEIVLYPRTAAGASIADMSMKGGELVRVTVRPKPGIHIYAPGQKGYAPVTLTFEPGVAMGSAKLPAPELYAFEATGEKFLVFKKTFDITQMIAAPAPGSKPLIATLKFQACDDMVCYRPEEAKLTW